MTNRPASLPLPDLLFTLIDRAALRLRPLAAHSLSLVPYPVEKPILEFLLNRSLAQSRSTGDFDFLNGRTVTVHVVDANWSMTITGDGNGRLRVLDAPGADTHITAMACDFLGLAACHIDPDTLYFQRRLRIEGNVALGLEVKNTLDGVDRTMLPPLLRTALGLARMLLIRRDNMLRSEHHAAPRLSSPARPCQ